MIKSTVHQSRIIYIESRAAIRGVAATRSPINLEGGRRHPPPAEWKEIMANINIKKKTQIFSLALRASFILEILMGITKPDI